MVSRLVNLLKLLGSKNSTFLFGPRGVGKTTLSEAYLGQTPASLTIDLLHHDLFSRYLANPSLIRLEIESRLKKHPHLTVLIDEVQKVPVLLDEVHSLLEKYKGQVNFVLTGSSARKLNRAGVNLLAGRAWTTWLHPLTHLECDLSLERALQFGTLPKVYLDDISPERTLKAYVGTYLQEEIQLEALVRNLQGFMRFLEIAAQMHGEPINFSSIGRETGVSSKTAQEYFTILTDTLIAFRLNGWSHSVRKQTLQSPKYYFFDCGVLNALRGELATELKPNSFRFGKLFETWVILEMIRLNHYFEKDLKFFYWRTNTQLEIDLIIQKNPREPLSAVEIKSSTEPTSEDLKSLISFSKEFPNSNLYVFSRTPHAYTLKGIKILPWQEGIKKLLT